MKKNEAMTAFGRLLDIIERLRAPDGCPWDREQTPMTMRGALTEESYELIHAIQENDVPGQREELGDVFLVASMIGEMKEGEGAFALADSLNEVSDKLIRRHPHVFGEAKADSSPQVLVQWEQIKAAEKGQQGPQSILHKAGRALPPLEKAQEIQKKAAKTGFDWDTVEGIFEKIEEETEEVRRELEEKAPKEYIEAEVGDLLFAVVNLARYLKVDAALALNRSIEKFKSRFGHIEATFQAEGRDLVPEHRERMEELWNEAKNRRETP